MCGYNVFSPISLDQSGTMNAYRLDLSRPNAMISIIPALTAANYRVIVMDSRGHGRSTASAKAYRYRLLAADVAVLLDHLGVAKADAIGWSDGGGTGYQLAIDTPDRLGRLLAFGANATLDGLKPGYGETLTFAA